MPPCHFPILSAAIIANAAHTDLQLCRRTREGRTPFGQRFPIVPHNTTAATPPSNPKTLLSSWSFPILLTTQVAQFCQYFDSVVVIRLRNSPKSFRSAGAGYVNVYGDKGSVSSTGSGGLVVVDTIKCHALDAIILIY